MSARVRFAAAGALLSVGLALAAGPGCERERRVPYVAPTLHNWPQPYHGVRNLRLHGFQTGTLRMLEGLFLRGGSVTRPREFPVLAYVLEHPRQGLVVLNTGLNHQLAEPEREHLGRVLSLAVTAALEPGQDLPSQMRAANLKPASVRWVILSNLRFAHAGEVEAFPEARVVVAKAEREQAREGGAAYLGREFDDVATWKFIDAGAGQPLGTMPAALDLFGDGSCLLLDARGPTAGSLAFLIRLPTRPLLLAGDLAPTAESVRYAAAPAALRDRDAWWDRIWRLKRFKDLDAALLVVPGYDPQPLRAAAVPEVRWHEFVSAKPAPETPVPTPPRPRLLPGLPGHAG